MSVTLLCRGVGSQYRGKAGTGRHSLAALFVNSADYNPCATVFVANWMVAVKMGRRAKGHNAALLRRIREVAVDVPSQATV